MDILLIEDEQRLARSYQRNLERAGHRTDVLYDAESAYARLSQEPEAFDVVILDVLLPGQSGIELCRRLRQGGFQAPILMLTALDQTGAKVTGLDAGADDYLTKPFPFDELLARLRALVRRPGAFDPVANATQMHLGDLLIDQLHHEVYVGDELIPLTRQEFKLLIYLARNADRVLTRQKLTMSLWPNRTEAGSNVLDTYVHHLRDKIELASGERLIQTVRGVGYMLRMPKGDVANG